METLAVPCAAKVAELSWEQKRTATMTIGNSLTVCSSKPEALKCDSHSQMCTAQRNGPASNVQQAHVQTLCQIRSHVESMNLFHPNLCSDPFTILQINSSALEIFMSPKGEKYPQNRVDSVSLGLEFLLPSVT